MRDIVARPQSGRRVLALLMALVMLVCALGATLPMAEAVTREQINNLKSQAASLNTQKADLQKQLDKLAGSKDAAVQQKQVLEQQINVLRDQIAVSTQAIAEYEQLIAAKEVELKEAQDKEAKYNALFLERVRSMEEDGTVSYLSVIFNAESFSDMLDQIDRVTEIMEYDNHIMDELAAARQAVADAKAQLEADKADEEAARSELAAQQADLVAQEKQVDSLIAQIKAQSATYASQLEELQADANAIAGQISSAEAAYAAQIAEARRQEELRRQQQQQQQQSGGGGSASTTTGSGGYIWPLSGYTRVSSPFGYRNCPFHGRELHGGCDIPAPGGTPIKAAKAGVVIISTYGASYGNYVVIAHGDGTRTMYAHQSSRAVSAGQTVSQGQTIGYVGSTGSSTGNHLHFEVWTGSSSSSRVNPLNYF